MSITAKGRKPDKTFVRPYNGLSIQISVWKDRNEQGYLTFNCSVPRFSYFDEEAKDWRELEYYTDRGALNLTLSALAFRVDQWISEQRDEERERRRNERKGTAAATTVGTAEVASAGDSSDVPF